MSHFLAYSHAYFLLLSRLGALRCPQFSQEGTFGLGQEIVRVKKVKVLFDFSQVYHEIPLVAFCPLLDLKVQYPLPFPWCSWTFSHFSSHLLYKPFSSVRPLSAFFHLLRNTFSHCLTLGGELGGKMSSISVQILEISCGFGVMTTTLGLIDLSCATLMQLQFSDKVRSSILD
ncbi:hypothetical protein F8388_023590 [Cannabis sativa]|uniref:Secreted protein n=1 Tax=Cannabis sativa TaxID=3483 RepID=A0A7J6G9D4_CANSA|nr:hypothetical protein F8388_023590 [Cannabis sativa]